MTENTKPFDDVEYATVDNCWRGQPQVIQSLTADDITSWFDAEDGKPKRAVILALALKSCVDHEPLEDGPAPKRIFTDEELQKPGTRNFRVLNRLAQAVLDFNGLGKDPVGAAKNGSSETAPTDLRTDSPKS